MNSTTTVYSAVALLTDMVGRVEETIDWRYFIEGTCTDAASLSSAAYAEMLAAVPEGERDGFAVAVLLVRTTVPERVTAEGIDSVNAYMETEEWDFGFARSELVASNVLGRTHYYLQRAIHSTPRDDHKALSLLLGPEAASLMGVA